MMDRSRIVREACEKDPELRDFNELDVDGIAASFQFVIDYVHDDVVPIGPGGLVGWRSKESDTWCLQMLRLYRFAIQYEMEDLADRTLDELQAHEYRCHGWLRMGWIQDVYQLSKPGSKLRLYCAAELYHAGMRVNNGVVEGPRVASFKTVRDRYPEAVDDLRRIAKVYKRQGKGGKVDPRNQKAFGICTFHTHPADKVCAAKNPEVLRDRSLGNDWHAWDEPWTKLKIPARPTDTGSGTESDASSVDGEREESSGLSNTEESAVETATKHTNSGVGESTEPAVETSTKHTSPDFEDSGLSVEDEEMEVFQNATSSTVPTLPSGDVGDDKNEKRQDEQHTSPVKCEGFPIPNPWGVCLPPRNEAEADRLNEFLRQTPQTRAESDEVNKFLEQVSNKGLDRYILRGPDQKVKNISAPTQPIGPTPKPVLKRPKVFQPATEPESAENENVFTCKTCDREFQRKQEFLKHVAQKDKLCVPRKRGCSSNPELRGGLPPLPHFSHKRRRLALEKLHRRRTS
jgi:hypothetical protein